MKFRGSVKRRLQRVVIATPLPPTPGARLLAGDDALRGTVLIAATQADRACAALVVIDVDSGPLHLADAPGTAVQVLPPPYTLDGA